MVHPDSAFHLPEKTPAKPLPPHWGDYMARPAHFSHAVKWSPSVSEDLKGLKWVEVHAGSGWQTHLYPYSQKSSGWPSAWHDIDDCVGWGPLCGTLQQDAGWRSRGNHDTAESDQLHVVLVGLLSKAWRSFTSSPLFVCQQVLEASSSVGSFAHVESRLLKWYVSFWALSSGQGKSCADVQEE